MKKTNKNRLIEKRKQTETRKLFGIRSFIKNHKRKLLASGLIITILILIPDIAFAQTKVSDAQKFMNMIATGVSWLLRVFYPLLWIVITFIGELMDNSMIFGEGMEEILLGMWRQIRNFVNIAFVIVLLGIAFYNILGQTEGNYVLKTIMPKFVIALVAVNFSFLACKVILDVSYMLTTTVAAIPASIYEGAEIKCPLKYEIKKDDDGISQLTSTQMTKCKISSVTIDLGGITKKIFEQTEIPENETDAQRKEREKAYMLASEQDVSVRYEDGLEIKDIFDVKSIALYMGVNILRITEIPKISFKAGDLSTLTINGIFGIMFMLIYLVSFVAMFLVLLARVAVLWVAIILSPVIALAWVLGDLFPMPEGKFNIKTMFIEHAFVPLKMMIPLTVGLMMVFKAHEIITTGNKDLMGGFTPDAEGKIHIDVHALVAGIGDARLILWNFAIVMIIWFGVFAAANKTVISEGIIAPLQQKLTAAAKFVAKAPTIIPFIPTKAAKTGEPMPISIVGGKKILSRLWGKYSQDLPSRRVQAVAPSLFAGSPDSIAIDIKGSVDPKDFIVKAGPLLLPANIDLRKHKDIQEAIASDGIWTNIQGDAFNEGLAAAHKAGFVGDDRTFKNALQSNKVTSAQLLGFLQGFKSVVQPGKGDAAAEKIKNNIAGTTTDEDFAKGVKNSGVTKDTARDQVDKGVREGLAKYTGDKDKPIIKAFERATADDRKIMAMQLGELEDIKAAMIALEGLGVGITPEQAKIGLAAEIIKKKGDDNGKTFVKDKTKFSAFLTQYKLTDQEDAVLTKAGITPEVGPQPPKTT